MNEASYIELISGRRRGPLASVQCGVLRAASWLYRPLIAFRNKYYGTWAMPAWLPEPVISVGNITAGGTGKTPMVIWVCERLLERGRKPAVLSRGYKAERGGWADELLLVSRRVPAAVAIAHRDRCRAGELAIQEYGATAAVLDDGFQHRRLGRDLEIVLIDATRPFGFGYLLPRGLLREPVHNLRRAEAIVVTRSDQVDAGGLQALESRLRELNPTAAIVRAVHAPDGFTDLAGAARSQPVGRVGAFAGIARPEAFLATLKGVGIEPAAERVWPDHHAYSAADAAELMRWARRERLDSLVTTEKDAVKLNRLDAGWDVPIAALRVSIELAEGGSRIVEMIDRMLLEHEAGDADGQHA